MAITIEPLGGPMGAVIHGLDSRASIQAAMDDYDVPRRMLRMIVGRTQ